MKTGFLFGAAFLILLVTRPTSASEDIGRQWLNLWTGCRIAVETGKDVDATGLDDLGLIKRTKPSLKDGGNLTIFAGYDYAEQSWGRQGNPFVIRETEVPTTGDRVRRICNVQFGSADHVVTDDEISSITQAFTSERNRLLALLGYEVRDPDHIVPVAVGIGPVANNPNGCRVISAVMIQFDTDNDKRPRSFSSFSGEQAANDVCQGPAWLKPKS